MKKLIFVALLVLIIQKWDVITAKPITPNSQVELYTTSWCQYCKKARGFLQDKGVKYTEYDIEKSAIGRHKYNQIGGSGIPVLVINGEIIRGYDSTKILKALTKT
ncbi:glutaredoxin family protein [Shewanella marina]|uniref:glutaredoxin family protein n=1 Tax=Shewanella marina TaxID=487319 RepID=UPI00046E7125|nr:glutaredoxin family protein [Shewanella marina]